MHEWFNAAGVQGKIKYHGIVPLFIEELNNGKENIGCGR
jgi:hypothetical protein